MAVATFTFGNPAHTMEVRWSALGFEEYLLDSQRIEKRWDMWTFSGERTFLVDGRQLRIAHHVSRNEFYARAYLDDELIVSELFPETAARFAQRRPRKSWRWHLGNFIVWMVIGFVGMYVYNHYRSAKVVAFDCQTPTAISGIQVGRPCS
jgi:hypothetical protein